MSRLVSVVMPVYNAMPFVKQAIESVLLQSYQNFELIVIDDGSTDGSWETIKSFSDPRIRHHRFSENLGIVQARAKGIELSLGELICWMDADDVCLPERFALQTALFSSQSGLIAVGGFANLVDENDEHLGIRYVPLDPDEIAARLLFGFPFVNPTLMFRADVLRGAITKVPANLKNAEDYVLMCLMAPSGKFANIGAPLIHYRIHQNDHKLSSNINNPFFEKGRKLAWTILLEQYQCKVSGDFLKLHHTLLYERGKIGADSLPHMAEYCSIMGKISLYLRDNRPQMYSRHREVASFWLSRMLTLPQVPLLKAFNLSIIYSGQFTFARLLAIWVKNFFFKLKVSKA